MESIMIKEKICSICGISKPITEYYSQKKFNKTTQEEYIYYNPECKECTKKRSSKWTNNNREKAKESNFKYKKTKRAKEKRKAVWMKNYRDSGKRKEWEQNNKDKLYNYSLVRSMNKKHEISEKEWDMCKAYFNDSCAYCGMTEKEHRKLNKQDLHKEHVNHLGSNDLSNCIPSCRNCNSQKWEFTLDEWYNESNSNYTYDRYNKIIKWLNQDYKKYIE